MDRRKIYIFQRLTLEKILRFHLGRLKGKTERKGSARTWGESGMRNCKSVIQKTNTVLHKTTTGSPCTLTIGN